MSKHSNHPPKGGSKHPSKAPSSLDDDTDALHDGTEHEPAGKYADLPEPAEPTAHIEPAYLAEDLPNAELVTPQTLPSVPPLRDGLVRVRVSSTHGAPRAATIDGKVVFFHGAETDLTVTQDDLKVLLNDPILRVHELVNGFTEAHRKEADLNVERAQMALSEALGVRDRVYARAPALNNVHAANLIEGGAWAEVQPSGEDIPIPPPPRMATVQLPYVQVENHELGHDVPDIASGTPIAGHSGEIPGGKVG